MYLKQECQSLDECLDSADRWEKTFSVPKQMFSFFYKMRCIAVQNNLLVNIRKTLTFCVSVLPDCEQSSSVAFSSSGCLRKCLMSYLAENSRQCLLSSDT